MGLFRFANLLRRTLGLPEAQRKWRVWFYCPDRHLSYDGATPEHIGVGGGVTARIRLAEALARRGHEVHVACNCPALAIHSQVTYVPLEAATRIDADVIVLHSSGGALDLSPFLTVKSHARLRIVFLGGIRAPKAAVELLPDAVYVPSNFVRDAVLETFPRVFVTHHGVVRRASTQEAGAPRDPHRLLYASHPSKGLNAAIEVWKLIRREHPGSELHVCGGNRLWGGTDDPPPQAAGLVYHGLIGQAALSHEFAQASFTLHLQTCPEAFGLSLVESMAMGCIPVASPVGAHPELIRDCQDGFLVPGHQDDPATHLAAAAVIATALEKDGLSAMRRQAIAAPLLWDTVAATWEAHWSILTGNREWEGVNEQCLLCGGNCALLPDGLHCLNCGTFRRRALGND